MTPTGTMFLLAIFSPLLVALVRRCAWRREVVELVAALIIVAIVTIGQWLDGSLTWPLSSSFWQVMIGAFGAQQLAYKLLWRDRPVTGALEQIGEPAVGPK